MRAYLACALFSILLINPVMSWAGSCPEGQKENGRSGECEPVKGSAKTNKTLSPGSGWRFERSVPVGAKKHGYQVVSAPYYPVRYGQNSEKFEVRPGDCSRSTEGGWDDCNNDRERSELSQRGDTQKEGDEYWYRWSIYIPESHQNLYRTKVCYGQFHQEYCEPVLMFNEHEGGYWLSIDEQLIDYGEQNINLLRAQDFVGRWNDIVVHIRWTKKKNGWVKVWVNGEEKVDYVGKTIVCRLVYFKYGVYRSFISRRKKLTETVTTTAYYDGVVRSKSKEEMFDALPE